jgi:hypothetical protein
MRQVRQIPVVVATAAIVALFLFLFFYAGVAPAPSNSPALLDRTRFIADEEERVRAVLRDPESARFRSESISTSRVGATLCGQVNSKNATGGYEGFQRFISGQTPTLMEGTIGPDEMNRQWTKLCGRQQ